MLRFSELFRATLVGLSLTLALPLAGCDGRKLQATEVPAGGVTLAYDLDPGGRHDAEIWRQETVNNRGESFTRSLSFTMKMQVLGPDPDDASQIRCQATIENLKLTWALPPSTPFSLSELIENMTKRLEGANIPIWVKTNGEFVRWGTMPSGLADEEETVLNSVLEGIQDSFYAVPADALDAGKSWTDEKERGRQGRLGKYSKESSTTTFEGLFKDKDNAHKGVLAFLHVDGTRHEETKTRDTEHSADVRIDNKVYFDTDARFLDSIVLATNKTQGATITSTRFRADWRHLAATAAPAPEPEPEPADDTEVQRIDDPCHDDYVGGEQCTDACHPNYIGDEACDESAKAEGEGAEGDAEGDAKAEGDDEAKAEGDEAEKE